MHHAWGGRRRVCRGTGCSDEQGVSRGGQRQGLSVTVVAQVGHQCVRWVLPAQCASCVHIHDVGLTRRTGGPHRQCVAVARQRQRGAEVEQEQRLRVRQHLFLGPVAVHALEHMNLARETGGNDHAVAIGRHCQ
ncbi:hypothetical protein FQZ97_1027140 [compost metagenome]